MQFHKSFRHWWPLRRLESPWKGRLQWSPQGWLFSVIHLLILISSLVTVCVTKNNFLDSKHLDWLTVYGWLLNTVRFMLTRWAVSLISCEMKCYIQNVLPKPCLNQRTLLWCIEKHLKLGNHIKHMIQHHSIKTRLCFSSLSVMTFT